MGLACEILSGRVTNPGATLTALTMATGDSLAVRSFDFSSGAALLELWAQGATAGTVRVRSPRTHDNVQGIRLNYLAADPRPLLGRDLQQRLFPQDVMTVEQSGGAAETDCVSLLVYYREIPGFSARLFDWAEIRPRIANILTVETQHTTGATAGDYGGGLAINANFDLLKANTDYAILGYVPSAAVLSVGYRGPDTGNARIGGPGSTQRDETRGWFVRLNQENGVPTIPVINAANKGSTLVDLVATATAAAVTVDTVLAELTSA